MYAYICQIWYIKECMYDVEREIYVYIYIFISIPVGTIWTSDKGLMLRTYMVTPTSTGGPATSPAQKTLNNNNRKINMKIKLEIK